MRTYGHWRILVSGHTMDACCQEVNGTRPPPETWGQGAATSIQPPELPSWPLKHLVSPLSVAVRVTWLMRTGNVTNVIFREVNRRIDTQSHRHFQQCANFARHQWLWPSAGFSSLKPSGDQALSRPLLQGNGWVRYLLWPVVSLKALLSVQFKSGLSTTVDYICSPSCLLPHAVAGGPPLFTAWVLRSIFTMAPNDAKWGSCMGLCGPIQELFVSAQ